MKDIVLPQVGAAVNYWIYMYVTSTKCKEHNFEMTDIIYSAPDVSKFKYIHPPAMSSLL